MTQKARIIESNHMDYASARVQFILGLFLILLLTLILTPDFSSRAVLISFGTSILVGLLFFEISNRYSNKIQATAAIWASLIWLLFCFTTDNGFSTWSGILPVFLFLRYELLGEEKHKFYFFASLMFSFITGLDSLICSLSGTILASLFLPRRYFSNPTLNAANSKKSALTPRYFVVLCTTLVGCYLLPFFSNKASFSNIASIETLLWLQYGSTNLNLVYIGFAAILLIRLLWGKLFLAPLLFCTIWTFVTFIPHPTSHFFQISSDAHFYLVPLTYLIVLACLPVFDILNRRNSLILAMTGSILMSLLCVCKGSTFLKSIIKTSWTGVSGYEQRAQMSPRSKHIFLAANLAPTIIGSAKIQMTQLACDEWISQIDLTTRPWFERTKAYLNLCAGPNRREFKSQSKIISVNGYDFESGVAITLASVKINPREANNVRITLSFPLSKNTRVNWLWKGNRLQEFRQATLELIDSNTLAVNLKNNPQWNQNDSIEQIGLFIPAGSTSLAIEKIEL